MRSQVVDRLRSKRGKENAKRWMMSSPLNKILSHRKEMAKTREKLNQIAIHTRRTVTSKHMESSIRKKSEGIPKRPSQTRECAMKKLALTSPIVMRMLGQATRLE